MRSLHTGAQEAKKAQLQFLHTDRMPVISQSFTLFFASYLYLFKDTTVNRDPDPVSLLASAGFGSYQMWAYSEHQPYDIAVCCRSFSFPFMHQGLILTGFHTAYPFFPGFPCSCYTARWVQFPSIRYKFLFDLLEPRHSLCPHRWRQGGGFGRQVLWEHHHSQQRQGGSGAGGCSSSLVRLILWGWF